MTRAKSDHLQGILGLLTLSLELGWGITLHIERIPDEVLRIEEGSLFPARRRMEHEGWIASEGGSGENNRPARSYRLTTQGKRHLRAKRENWRKVTQAVSLMLDLEPA